MKNHSRSQRYVPYLNHRQKQPSQSMGHRRPSPVRNAKVSGTEGKNNIRLQAMHGTVANGHADLELDLLWTRFILHCRCWKHTYYYLVVLSPASLKVKNTWDPRHVSESIAAALDGFSRFQKVVHEHEVHERGFWTQQGNALHSRRQCLESVSESEFAPSSAHVHFMETWLWVTCFYISC